MQIFSSIFQLLHAYRMTGTTILRGALQGYEQIQKGKTHHLAAAPRCPERFPCRFGRSTDTCRDPTWLPLPRGELAETGDESENSTAPRLQTWTAQVRRFVTTTRNRSGIPKQSS
jgi:hypothetical protein